MQRALDDREPRAASVAWRHLAVAEHLAVWLDRCWDRDKQALLLASRLGLHQRPGRERHAQAVSELAQGLAGLTTAEAGRVLAPLVRRHGAELLRRAAEVMALPDPAARGERLRALAEELGLSWLVFWATAVQADHPTLLGEVWAQYGPALRELDRVLERGAPRPRAAAPASDRAANEGRGAAAARELAALRRQVEELKERAAQAERQAAQARRDAQEAERRAAALARELDQARRELAEREAAEQLLLQWVEELAREPNWPAVQRYLAARRQELLARLARDPAAARPLVVVEDWLRWLEAERGREPAEPATPGSPPAPAAPAAGAAPAPPPAAPATPAVTPEPPAAEVTVRPARVLLVGGAREEPYRSRFEAAGLEFEWLDGDAQGEPLRAAIRRADVVVLMLSHAAHATSGAVFAYLRELGRLRRCVVPRGPGVSGILRDVQERLRQLAGQAS